jgi:aspartyl/asparaginyl beta-hydroxylase (cupin superfamily)
MSNEQALLRAARDAEAGGDAATARQHYEQLLTEDPQHPQAINGLARLALVAGDAEGAVAVVERIAPARTEIPLLTDALLLKAAAHRLLGQMPEEEASLQQALAADAYCWPALLQRAQLLERQGQMKFAALMYRDVLKISPPLGYRPPAFAEALERAEQLVAMYSEALEVMLLEALGAAASQSQKWRESISIMSGRTKPFVSQCNQLTVPRLPAQPFFRREMFDWVPAFEAYTADIRAEMIAALSEVGDGFTPYVQYNPGEPVNQWADLNHSRAWTAFHLWRGGKPIPENIARCPKTAEALRLVDQVHLAGTCPNAMFSVLQPKAVIPPHHGESNARLVAHLPLVVPEKCQFRVGYDTRQWVEGEVMVFDDTIEHEAVNDSDQLRVVLLFDVWNPLLSIEERQIVQKMSEVERKFRLG